MADRTTPNPELPFDDTTDFDDARRGLIGRLEPYVVKADDGCVVPLAPWR